MSESIDFKAFRVDFAEAIKGLEEKYNFSMGLGNITYDSVTGAFRSQFDATPVELIEGIDVLKSAKLTEISSLRSYCGTEAFKKRIPSLSLKGDIVAIGFVPQRKFQVTAIVVTGPNKGKVYVISKEQFGFKV